MIYAKLVIRNEQKKIKNFYPKMKF